MKYLSIKRCTSLILVMAMCFSLFTVFGAAGVGAVGEQKDVIAIRFPREGDANANGAWGHRTMQYMNG